MPRRTKIVATVGPATASIDVLSRIIKAGVDVIRVNCSHGTINQLQERIENIRAVVDKTGLETAILLDLQGPKIRVNSFINGSVELKTGQQFKINTKLDENSGTEKEVGTDYKNLPKDVKPGNILLLDDGRLSLRVESIDSSLTTVTTKVVGGGKLSNNKGINLLGGGLSADVLTEKDKEDISLVGKLNIDYIALSFVRNKSDILAAKKLLTAHKSRAGIIAKIERAEALETLDDIISVSDGVMVARGDLGVEIGDAELPAVQKNIISRARALDKVVITATQMMESMIESPLPTRAEVFDVANAVLDGTDAVMLSAETAVGKYPVEVVAAMDRICLGAEQHHSTKTSGHRLECTFKRADEAIAMAAMYVANHMDVKAIITLTETGSTPLWMSRIRSGIPVYALSRFKKTRLKMKLFRGVYPIYFDVTKLDRAEVNLKAVDELLKLKVVKKGDCVVMARGDFLGVEGGCNTLKILKVGQVY